MVRAVEDGRTVEIGAIGIEGVTSPLSLSLSLLSLDIALTDEVVSIPGTAYRIGCDALMREIEDDRTFRQLMRDYMRFAFSQVTRSVACSRLHHLAQRCCLWLLMAQDSALSDEFPLTHESLAMVLGYQRAGVSIAMRSLVKAGLIEHKRGTVRITNRPGLTRAACECYLAKQNEFDEMFPVANTTGVFGFEQKQIIRWR